MIDFTQRLDTFGLGESAWKEWQKLTQQTPEADLVSRVIDEHMAHIADLVDSGALTIGDKACVLTEITGTTLALLDIFTTEREAHLVSQSAGHRIANRIMAILKGKSVSHAAE